MADIKLEIKNSTLGSKRSFINDILEKLKEKLSFIIEEYNKKNMEE